MKKPLLLIKDLIAGIEGKQILNGISLTINEGEIHAVMGPNGSGKSTLSKVLSGHPAFSVKSGTVTFQGNDLLPLDPSERAKAGVFLAFQYPMDIPGVTNLNFLRSAYIEKTGKDLSVLEFRKILFEKMTLLGMDPSFATRAVNVGFSGGEKKRNEILQMALLQPSLAILDETDSGLDIDALRVVSQGVNTIMGHTAPRPGVLLITHYNRILNYIKPDYVHVLAGGRIVRSGQADLARELEERGYDWVVGEAMAANG